MKGLKSHQEKTSAEDKSIGFEYQYYYFLYLILGLESGQSIGLEIKDDLHIDFPDGKQTLLQLKHSIQTNTEGDIINLRESDSDLWKTLYNWIKVINDSTQGRTELKSQIDYIERTNFILVSNKADNKQNQFLVNFDKYKQGLLNIDEFRVYIREKYDTALKKKKEKKKDEYKENDKLLNYIFEILNQEEEWLKKFLEKLSFSLDEDDLIERIRLKIKDKFIPENMIEDVFNSLDSNLRRDNYLAIKKREKIEYSFDDLYEKYTRCFLLGRTNKRVIRREKPIIEGNPEEQLFIKQLEDIEVISKVDEDYQDQIIKRTIAKLLTQNNLKRWEQEGELMGTEKEKFDGESKYEWESIFERTYRKLKRKLRNEKIKIDENEIIDLANECLDEILSMKLNFDGTELDLEISNGQYYLLSDKPVIGWRYDWDKRYKKHE
jgi:hypothetical protein